MLNMRSGALPQPDDRTVRARVRDAAIDLVAERGPESLTARAVADRAGVSPGSVINNFGSMGGLRTACDEHVVTLIRRVKSEAMAKGMSLDLVGALRDSDLGPLAGYLAAVVAEDSPAVARLVDELVDDAEAYIATGVATGMLRPTDDPRGRAVLLMIFGLGALVLHEHLHRLLDVDLTAPDTSPEALGAYLRPVYQLYAEGLFTEEFGRRAAAAVAGLQGGPTAESTTTTDGSGTDAGLGETHE
jgi:AcrR family transcriptional regulator